MSRDPQRKRSDWMEGNLRKLTPILLSLSGGDNGDAEGHKCFEIFLRVAAGANMKGD